jgi:hypothetical protein
MRWSIMKRIGRGLAAISSTASTKLTWLQTSTAAPWPGNVLVARAPGSGRPARRHPGHEAQQVLGHQQEDVERHHRIGQADHQEHLRDGQASFQQQAPR